MPVWDKIAASKQKGLRMGGPAALGYRIEGKKLVIEPSEAEQVRMIFRRYLKLESLTALMKDHAISLLRVVYPESHDVAATARWMRR